MGVGVGDGLAVAEGDGAATGAEPPPILWPRKNNPTSTMTTSRTAAIEISAFCAVLVGLPEALVVVPPVGVAPPEEVAPPVAGLAATVGVRWMGCG